MSYQLKTKNTPAPEIDAVPYDETLGLISLEPRILLDAAGIVTGAEVAVEAMAAEGVEMGVQAIFEDSEDPTAAPFDGPWLEEVTEDSTGDTSEDDPTAVPFGGPWLEEITSDSSGDTSEDDPTAVPFGGPWLGEVQLAQDDTSTNDDPSAVPFGGPWL